jgi:hypothetical protein
VVTLAPGQTASALLGVVDARNYPAAACDPVAATTLRVYPPSQAVPELLPYASTGCVAASVKLLQVRPARPGTGASPGSAAG